MNRQQRRALSKLITQHQTPARREALAHHEAGHAVAAYHLGLSVEWIALNGEGEAEGVVSTTKHEMATLALGQSDEYYARMLLLPLAGPDAESLYHAEKGTDDAGLKIADSALGGDNVMIHNLFQIAQIEKKRIVVIMKKAQDLSFEFVIEHWPEIQAVAKTVLTVYPKRLDGKEIQSVIARVTGLKAKKTK